METHLNGRESYDLTICYEIHGGQLTRDQLALACTALMMRHDALRTSFRRVSSQETCLINNTGQFRS